MATASAASRMRVDQCGPSAVEYLVAMLIPYLPD
jgi:hypothetical protein